VALRVGKSCEASIVVDAPVEAVWALVSDVTRAGDWSVECRGAEWMDGASGPVKGARFRGRNRRNATRWSRVCEILEVDAPRKLAWRTLPTRLLPDSTRWEFELTPSPTGTTLTQRMQVLQIPGLYDRLFAAMLPQHRDRTADIEADLARVKARVEKRSQAAV
jgi:uncharacterized protein YndB with AHSA1/START domain